MQGMHLSDEPSSAHGKSVQTTVIEESLTEISVAPTSVNAHASVSGSEAPDSVVTTVVLTGSGDKLQRCCDLAMNTQEFRDRFLGAAAKAAFGGDAES
jgi:hypothetical protein